jgi:hypothetical protein
LKHHPERFYAVGTTPEWIKVLELGVIFAAAIVLFDAIGDREPLAWPNLVGTAFSSLFFGMLSVFGWRVLHGSIAVVFFGVLLVAFGTGFLFRRARKRAEIASKKR